jgi:hypothetical protein
VKECEVAILLCHTGTSFQEMIQHTIDTAFGELALTPLVDT